MKKLIALFLCLMLLCAFSAAPAEGAVTESKGRVVILATGGTIAGVGEAGKTASYKPGSLTVEELLYAVPQLTEVADIDAIQICNVNSDDMTAELWITLANTINELAEDPEIKGFVVTHGTDTMEETAYFLSLTVNTDKPVVLTGSMRPATSISADGPMNLYESVCVAASDAAAGHGVMIVFADQIYAARSVFKASTYSVMAITGENGMIGIVRDGNVYLEEAAGARKERTYFDVSGLDTLPKVSILYFSVDADPGLLRYAAGHSDGLVIAGAGAGEFSLGWIEVIRELQIPVVVSSRIDMSVILKDNLLVDSTVAANTLSPQKAAILLRLALAQGVTDREKLAEIFLTH